MDMQGTPIGSTQQGMKNTSDPERYTNPTTENAGAVASDSLAAESVRSGGGFGDNRGSQPLKQSGSTSTFNNTDTSGATTLAPAPNATERESKDAFQNSSEATKGTAAGLKYPEGVGGQPKFPGQHNLDGYAGGPTSAKVQTSGSGGSSGLSSSDTSSGGQASGGPTTGQTSSSGGASQSSGSTGSAGGQTSGADAKSAPTENTFGNQSSSNVDAAPGYVGSVVSEAAKTGKPKGKNITEGGFDEGDDKNASFNSEIGSENDPGRVAEGNFQKITQSASGSTGPRQAPGASDNSQYDVLETDQNL